MDRIHAGVPPTTKFYIQNWVESMTHHEVSPDPLGQSCLVLRLAEPLV